MKLPLVGDDARTLAIFDRLERKGLLQLAVRMAFLYRITSEALVGRAKSRTTVAARQHLCALIRWSTALSFPEIGALLDLDHTTVIHAVRVHEARINAEMAEPQAVAS